MREEEPRPVKTPTCSGCVLLAMAFVGLLALLFYMIPIGPSGNKTSKAQLCSTNMSLLAMAFAQYSQDYDGCYPNGVIRNSSGAGWAGQLFPYAKTDAVYRCAADLHTVAPPESALSYGYNSNVARTHIVTGLSSPSVTVLLFEVGGSAARIVSPGRQAWDEGASDGATAFSAAGNGLDSMLVSSTPAGKPTAGYATGPLGGRQPLTDRSQFGDAPRHDGVAQFLFGDGHVAALPGSSVSSGTNAARNTAPQTGSTFGSAAGTSAFGKSGTFSTN